MPVANDRHSYSKLDRKNQRVFVVCLEAFQSGRSGKRSKQLLPATTL